MAMSAGSLILAGRHGRQAAHAAERAGADPPAVVRLPGPVVATSRSTPARCSSCARCSRRSTRGTPAGRSSEIHDDMERDRFFGAEEAVELRAGGPDRRRARAAAAAVRLRARRPRLPSLNTGGVRLRRRSCSLAALRWRAAISAAGDERRRRARAGAAARDHAASWCEHLDALQRIADRNGGNRAAGTPGYDASARYVAGALRAAGWSVRAPAVPLPVVRAERVLAERRRPAARARRDFRVLIYSGSGRASGRAARRRQRLHARTTSRGLGPGDVPLVEPRRAASSASKAGNAAARRAPARSWSWTDVRDRRGVRAARSRCPGMRIPVVLVADARSAARPTAARGRARGRGRASRAPGAPQNVIAETPGGERRPRGDGGGHLDSVPAGPGINDNGSGVAALLEAGRGDRPRPAGRAACGSAFWGAEESACSARAATSARSSRDGAPADPRVPEPRHGRLAERGPELYADGDAGARRACCAARPARPLGDGRPRRAPPTTCPSPRPACRWAASSPARRAGPGGRPRDPCYHLACDTARQRGPLRSCCGWRARPRRHDRAEVVALRRSRRRARARRTAPAAARPRTSSTRPPGSRGWRSAPRTAGRPARSR